MKLIIDIPEETKQAFDKAESNDLKGGYYDHGGVIGKAIQNGTPLDSNSESSEKIKKLFREIWFKDIWDCDIYHRKYDYTVGEIVEETISLMNTLSESTIEKIRAEIEQFREALVEKAPSLKDLVNAQRTVDICLGIIDNIGKGDKE